MFERKKRDFFTPTMASSAIKSFYDLSAKALSGEMVSFKKFQGKVVLVQNTASL